MQENINEQKCYPLHMDHLPEYFQVKALKELNETPEIRKVELKKLKDLLSDDKLTSCIEFEDDFLQQYLRYSKYDSFKAFQHVQKCLNFRRNYSNMFQSIPDEHFDGNPSTKFYSVLPYRCPEGCAIILGEIGKWNPSELSLEYVKREGIAVFLQPLRCPVTQICGFKIIYDFKDTVKLMRFATPQNFYLIYTTAFNCLPARYKEVHFVNKSIALGALWAVVKHVIPEKLRKRIFFHSNPEDLLNHFPSSILPTQYGGSLINYHDAELMKKINMDHGKFPVGGQRNYF